MSVFVNIVEAEKLTGMKRKPLLRITTFLGIHAVMFPGSNTIRFKRSDIENRLGEIQAQFGRPEAPKVCSPKLF